METELTKKLMSICALNPTLENLDNTFGINNLTEDQRIQVEKELIKHFDFERIVWMELPSGLTEDKTTPIVPKILKISDDNPKHTGQIGYVYTISFTPRIYDPKEMHEPVKDGCVFSPIIYNPKTFEPKRSITLTWSPEFPQNIDAPERTYEDDKQMIRDMLEKVLDNPKEYEPEGFRACLVRFVAI